MKTYTGVKIVKAKPGTMAEAKAMIAKCSVEVQETIFKQSGVKNEMGYIVMYPDGYVSWSPKEVFENAYRELDCVDFINSTQEH